MFPPRKGIRGASARRTLADLLGRFRRLGTMPTVEEAVSWTLRPA